MRHDDELARELLAGDYEARQRAAVALRRAAVEFARAAAANEDCAAPGRALEAAADAYAGAQVQLGRRRSEMHPGTCLVPWGPSAGKAVWHTPTAELRTLERALQRRLDANEPAHKAWRARNAQVLGSVQAELERRREKEGLEKREGGLANRRNA